MYWLVEVYIVAIWRWPNASYSVSSISEVEMPIREAASRSISIARCGAAICWSEATSCSSGSFRIAASTIGAQWFSSALSVSVSVYWYWVRLRRPPTLMSWPDCMKNLAPCTCATLGRRRWIT